MRNFNIFVFFGAPGVGKGTISKFCSEKFQWEHVSTGTLCRKTAEENDCLGQKISEIIKNGNLIEDNLMLEMLFNHLNFFFSLENKNKNTVILDGFPRNENQIKLLVDQIKKIENEKRIIFKLKFFLFDAKDKTVIQRLKNRVVCSNKKCEFTGSIKNNVLINCPKCSFKMIKRDDDNEEIINQRLKAYRLTNNNFYEFIKNNSLSFVKIDADKNETQEEFIEHFVEILKNEEIIV
jgi:adenylate kinase